MNISKLGLESGQVQMNDENRHSNSYLEIRVDLPDDEGQ